MATATPVVGSAFTLQPYVPPKVEAILLWRDPLVTGVVVGTATLLFAALKATGGSTFILTLYLLAAAVAGAVFWQLGAGIVGRPGPPALPTEWADESWSKVTTQLRPSATLILGYVSVLVSGKNPVLSAKVVAALLLTIKILSSISVPATAYTLLLVAVSVPKVYELRKDDIDKALAPVVAKAKELWAKVDELVLKKIPKPAAKQQ